MLFLKLYDETEFEGLGIDLGWLIVKEEISVVYDRTWEKSLDDELGALKVYEDLDYTFFDHLDGVHWIPWFEDEGAGLVLYTRSGIDKLVNDKGRDPFSEEIDLLEH